MAARGIDLQTSLSNRESGEPSEAGGEDIRELFPLTDCLAGTYQEFAKCSVPLKFYFGDWCIHIENLMGAIALDYFLKLPERPPQTAAINHWTPGVEVLYMPSHPIDGRLSKIELTPRTIRYVPSQYNRYYIDIDGDFSQYLKKFSSKTRTTMRKHLRRYVENCGTSQYFREYALPEEMDEFYRLARNVSRVSFQEKLGVGLPASDEFRLELLKLARRGLVRGYILFMFDRASAYQFCRVNGDCLTLELCGYDPEVRHLSPGSILTFLILERVFTGRAFRRMDLGTGDLPYKAFYSTGIRQCANIYYLHCTIRNAGIILAHSAVRGVWWCIARSLDLVGVRARLKKRIRSYQRYRSAFPE